MLLDKVFEPFIKDKPICVMARAVLQRILDPQHIDQLFARTARRQYTNELLFSRQDHQAVGHPNRQEGGQVNERLGE